MTTSAFFTAHLIADMAEDNSADRPRQKADGVGGEGGQGADQRIIAGKEKVAEEEYRSGAVGEKSHNIPQRCRWRMRWQPGVLRCCCRRARR
ncbi:hypothetical protein OJE16_10335 [Pantoea tagorei]